MTDNLILKKYDCYNCPMIFILHYIARPNFKNLVKRPRGVKVTSFDVFLPHMM